MKVKGFKCSFISQFLRHKNITGVLIHVNGLECRVLKALFRKGDDSQDTERKPKVGVKFSDERAMLNTRIQPSPLLV